MSVRNSPLNPMTKSGHCQWPTPIFGHAACRLKGCTCDCHGPIEQMQAAGRRTMEAIQQGLPPAEEPAPPPKRRTRKKLI